MNMDRTCTRCFKQFKYPKELRRHQQRKTPCAPILEDKDLPAESLEDAELGLLSKRKCRFCGRVFSSYNCMRRHVRNNCKIPPNERNGDVGMELLYKHTVAKQQEQIEAQRRQIEKLTKMMAQQMALAEHKAPPRSSICTRSEVTNSGGEVAIQGNQGPVTVDNSKKQQITINVFGQEKLDHIEQEQIRQILAEASAFAPGDGATQAVLEAAMLIYSDPKRPENITCYLPNKKMQEALVHRRDGWEVEPVPRVLPPMMTRSVDVLFDHQPREGDDLKEYGEVLKQLQECEKDAQKVRHLAGPNGSLRAVLVRNKDQLRRLLDHLPVPDEAPEPSKLLPT